MMWIKMRNSEMEMLTFQLIVVFCLINGRFAYRDYASDDAGDFGYESGSNFSQYNSNEPPGKRIFLKNFKIVQSIFHFNF